MKKIGFLIILLLVIGLVIIFLMHQKQKITTQNKSQIWTLLAIGDIQLSREVGAKINQFGVDYPFQRITNLTQAADLTIGNLESPLTDGRSNADPNSMIFGAEIKSVEGLKNAGFDVLNLANNHFANQGQTGMDLTFQTLNQQGISYFGAGYNFDNAHHAQIKTIGKIKIALLGYTDSDVLPTNSNATAAKPGVAAMDIEQVKIDIAKAKTQADLVVVSMHSGYEYTPNPNRRQIEFAHSAVTSGADLVIGHHPHVVQAIEDYKGKKIFYSLGNFIFDQPWSAETKQGLAVKLTFNGAALAKTELIPVKIENWCQPRVLAQDEPEYQTVLNRIQTATTKLE